MEPVKTKKSVFDDMIYDLSVEKKFNSGIEFGKHGINLGSHVKFNSEDTTVIRYFVAGKCKNLSGYYVLFDVPHAAAGIFLTVDMPHPLKRTPQGLILIQQTGIDRATFPHPLKEELSGVVCLSDSLEYWNSKSIRLKFVKILGSTFPSRLLGVLI